MRRPLLAGLAGLALLILMPAPASLAHANLDASEPAAGARLAQAPTDMRLSFTQGLNPDGSWAQVSVGDSGDLVLSLDFDPEDSTLMTASIEGRGPGLYEVRWQSLSAEDDDYADGRFEFVVLNPDGSDPTEAEQPGAEVPEDDDGGGLALPLLLAVGAAGAMIIAALAFTLRTHGAGR